MTKLTMKVGLFAIAILFVFVGAERTPVTAQMPTASANSDSGAFPALTGPYKVGRTAYEWVDQSRAEAFASIPGLKRDLMVTIWFPASPGKHSKVAPYMADSVMWDIVTRHPELENVIQARAYTTSTVNPDKPSYPVLVFDPDTAVTSFNYASIIEELASHGYIVVGLSHPYDTADISYPDGRIVMQNANGVGIPSGMDDVRVRTVLIEDVHFVLDQIALLNTSDPDFKGRLDLTRIGIMGHLYGGLVAVFSAAGESRIKAGASLENDPSMQMPPVNKPFLYLGIGASPSANQQTHDSYWMISSGISTGNYGDFPWLKPYYPLGGGETFIGSIAPARSTQIINGYLLAFFDHYLNGAALNWPSYAETKFVTFPTITTTPAN